LVFLKTRNLFFTYQKISRNIKKYQEISRNIKIYQKISKNIKKHQKLSKMIKKYQQKYFNKNRTFFEILEILENIFKDVYIIYGQPLKAKIHFFIKFYYKIAV
jgi:hypothetical protein